MIKWRKTQIYSRNAGVEVPANIYFAPRKSSRSGEIGRRAGFKIQFWQQSVGSSPTSGTIIPMHIERPSFINRLFIILLTTCAMTGLSTSVFGWGHDGHAAVGILALGQLSAETRTKLERVLGSLDDQTIVEACNWPDSVRRSDEWAWSYPLHFINIPIGESHYLQTRDCPDQQCATEAIKKYSLELGDQRAHNERRRQAFAWVCHLVGDLHQPLHAGFAHDRGGNEFEITFKGEQTNLHNFWDRALIKDRVGDWQELLRVLSKYPTVQTGDYWTGVMVYRWTEESHRLAEEELYPASPEITQNYADKSWAILQQRISTAASRLALIIESIL